ncbi:LysR family transcriptional regulator [Vibrio echinoideorum]|uniref:LysR family transcriptional regulator n=1 Tax=Vibrio echinoideorum TaxID=2100116 RepID=A0ABU9FXL1_9VIBR
MNNDINELNVLRVFLALMQTGSTSRAAMKLGRSQSYISKMLAQLRETLDDPLFIRSPEGMVPTSYALAVEPKLKAALESVFLALEPAHFEPRKLTKVSLHIIEPYLVQKGSAIIKAIRQETDAIIDMRTWGEHSESLLLREDVDLGIHILSDKPQSFYQKRLHQGSASFKGNIGNREYVKYVVAGVNDHENLFNKLDPTIKPKLYIDNYQLMSQLMDDFYTLRYNKVSDELTHADVSIDIALIVKSSRRHSAKIEWLCELVEPIINQGSVT